MFPGLQLLASTTNPATVVTAPSVATGGKKNEMRTIEEDIAEIIDTYVKAEASAEGIRTVNPTLLLENAAFLAKGRLYESVMKRRMGASTTPETARLLESVDSFLLGFIQAERKSRSRLKVNYIMAGATTGRLDESIELLYEADEIDEDLLLYLNGLVNKQLMRSAGPAAESIEDVPAGSSGQQSIEVLRMIYKRIEAQMKTQGKKELMLLARLFAENDPQRRESLLRSRLGKVEEMDEFALFVASGIEHMTRNEQAGEDKFVGKLERMKDIMRSVRQLAVFSNQDEVFQAGQQDEEEGGVAP